RLHLRSPHRPIPRRLHGPPLREGQRRKTRHPLRRNRRPRLLRPRHRRRQILGNLAQKIHREKSRRRKKHRPRPRKTPLTQPSALNVSDIAARIRSLQEHATAHHIPIQLKPGGELRLSPHVESLLPKNGGGGIPTYGHANKYVLADLWEYDWPPWADDAVRFL